ncbi:MAG TPA: ABC transporter ATP-binding protein/permease [Acetobacteraceae bacterium]|nr:ABC transporter ATP-binding protein/permease [Acetobacteraceae bacterium]
MRGLGSFLKEAYRLAKPYYTRSDERWSAWGLLITIIVLNLSMVGISVISSYWHREFYNALQEKDWRAFLQLLFLYRHTPSGWLPGFCEYASLLVAIGVYKVYLNQWLQIRWRRWMTTRYLDEWLADRAYYRISLTTDRAAIGTDNPDQRIAEDLRDFTDTTLSLSLDLLSNIVSLGSFVTILWSLSGSVMLFGITIPGYMVWAAVVYAVIGTCFTHLVGRPLAALNFRQQRVEADFRYSLVRVRENMEGIALYRGEHEEQGLLLHRFGAVIGNWYAIMRRTKLLNILVYGYGQAAVIFPVIVAAPRYFSGAMQLGGLVQTAGAFGQVQGSLSWFVDAYASLANWRAIVERLATFHGAIVAARAAAGHDFERMDAADGTVRLHDVTLALPNGTNLLEHADLVLQPGHSVVVTGRSGSGKSTLFRAFAGIWPFGQGHMEVPERAFFLPQRPYIPLGTLRHVIAYPHPADDFDRAALAGALADVGLSSLVDELDHAENWPMRLSGGEQQRVAIARALLARPDWLFLDEATASLDPDAENELYRVLRERLPNTTLVSIAHRASVAAFHEQRLVFRREEGKSGELVPVTSLPAAAD